MIKTGRIKLQLFGIKNKGQVYIVYVQYLQCSLIVYEFRN